MKKITTKYLRENLAEIIDKVNEAQVEYLVSYRKKVRFKITPFEENKKRLSVREWAEQVKVPSQVNILSRKDEKNAIRKYLNKKHGKIVS